VASVISSARWPRTLGATLDRFYAFVGRYWVDCAALLGSFATFVAGLYLAWNSSPVWLNRAGALIVVIGVILATSRVHRWLERWTSAFFERSYDSSFRGVAAKIGRQQGDPLPAEVRNALYSEVRGDIRKLAVRSYMASGTILSAYSRPVAPNHVFESGR
jgi:hypothetical protein